MSRFFLPFPSRAEPWRFIPKHLERFRHVKSRNVKLFAFGTSMALAHIHPLFFPGKYFKLSDGELQTYKSIFPKPLNGLSHASLAVLAFSGTLCIFADHLLFTRIIFRSLLFKTKSFTKTFQLMTGLSAATGVLTNHMIIEKRKRGSLVEQTLQIVDWQLRMYIIWSAYILTNSFQTSLFLYTSSELYRAYLCMKQEYTRMHNLEDLKPNEIVKLIKKIDNSKKEHSDENGFLFNFVDKKIEDLIQFVNKKV